MYQDNVNKFQFLIGSLKTMFIESPPFYLFLFQFLIGSLKTSITKLRKGVIKKVSIPHR